jgi:hypothetical protein
MGVILGGYRGLQPPHFEVEARERARKRWDGMGREMGRATPLFDTGLVAFVNISSPLFSV